VGEADLEIDDLAAGSRMETITFHTDRLVATRLDEIDLSELCRMHRDAKVMATLGGPRSDERTREFLRTNLGHWDDHGFGLWVFRAASKGTFVGRGGLRHVVSGAMRYALTAHLTALTRNLGSQGLRSPARGRLHHITLDQGLPCGLSLCS
jgi:RimJ/RimL family protein N-acetyltransferase